MTTLNHSTAATAGAAAASREEVRNIVFTKVS